MSVYAMYVSSKTTKSAQVDRILRLMFGDVYRVGQEFWLIDTGRDVDDISFALRSRLDRRDKLFVAAITRDFYPLLSRAAIDWLTSGSRSWAKRTTGRGQQPVAPMDGLLAA